MNIHEITIVNFFHLLEKDPKRAIDTSCSDRMNELLKRFKLSKIEFSKSLGLSNSNQINSILNEKSNIKVKLAYKINKAYPDVPFRGVLKGES